MLSAATRLLAAVAIIHILSACSNNADATHTPVVKEQEKVQLAQLLQLSRPGTWRVTVSGTSMLPAIPPGSVALLERANSLNVGDVVSVRHGDTYYIHRVVRTTESTIVTRGDANFGNDPEVALTNVQGRVWCVLY